MKKPNVLHLITSMNMGGGARGVRTFYRYTQNDLNAHVICYSSKGEKYDQFTKICKTLSFLPSQGKIKKYIADHKIDIIHLYGRGVLEEFEKKLLTDLKGKVKIVYSNIFGQYDPESDELIDLYIFKSMHCLDQIFAHSAGIKITKDSHFYDRLRVIPNPVDLENFKNIKPKAADIKKFRYSLNIQKEDILIGKIGARKAIEKWSDLPLYALPEIIKKHPRVVMLLQGVPDSRVRWVKSFGDHTRVIEETTSDRELAIMYNAIEIFTHASKIGEHSGNSINEAMYWGLPVIVNVTPDKDNGQMEQVTDGVNGYFANDPDLYAKRVNELLAQKKRITFGRNAHQFILKNNNPTKLAKDLINTYQFLITRNSFQLTIKPEKIIDYDKSYPKIIKKFMIAPRTSPISYRVAKVRWKVQDYIDHNYRKR